MDVLKLSRIPDTPFTEPPYYENNPSTFVPVDLIEGYTSMIWTERYLEPGDFEMKTPLVGKTRGLLPENSIISLRDSSEVMVVESHSIGSDSEGNPELTITGRSLVCYLDYRQIKGTGLVKVNPNETRNNWTRRHKLYKDYSPRETAMAILWDMFVNPTTQSITGGGRSRSDSFIGTAVSNSTTVTGPGRLPKWVFPGAATEQVRGFLKRDRLGLRTIRPNSPLSGVHTRVAFDVDELNAFSAANGAVLRTLDHPAGNEMRWDIYNGEDRTANVIFHVGAGHLDKLEYLFSSRNFITQVTAYAGSEPEEVQAYAAPVSKGGPWAFDRRHMSVDAGTPQLPYPDPPTDPVTENGQTVTVAQQRTRNRAAITEFVDEMQEFAKSLRDKYERTVLFNGEIVSTSGYVYGKDYFLGDHIMLMAEYDLTRKMRISEYVRTEDAEGDRGYPNMSVDQPVDELS